jgi:hypothetical protein
MPLIKSSSPEAFRSNVSEMIKAGHSRDQSLAAAFRAKREAVPRRAFGGLMSPERMVQHDQNAAMFRSMRDRIPMPMGGGMRTPHVGAIRSPVAGRTDHHPMFVHPGSYVLPADHVSSLGQGNTEVGHAILGRMFPHSRMGMPAAGVRLPHLPGIRSDRGGARGSEVGEPVPIYAAGGEFVIHPHDVLDTGGGDMKRGHAVLDRWVNDNRKKHIKTLKKLPGPAKA